MVSVQEVTRLSRTTKQDTSCERHGGGGKVRIAHSPRNTGMKGHEDKM